MGTFRALWLVRKETFSYKLKESGGEFTVLKDLIAASIAIVFMSMALSALFASPILFITEENPNFILFTVTAIVMEIFTLYFWVLPVVKYMLSAPHQGSEYFYKIHSFSAIHRLNKQLSILNLELKFEPTPLEEFDAEGSTDPYRFLTRFFEGGNLKLFVKGTNEYPIGAISTSSHYNSYSELNLFQLGETTHGSVICGFGPKKFNLSEGFVFSKLWRHTTWKAFTFLVAQLVLKKDLKEYGNIWFQTPSSKKVFKAAKLGVTATRFIEFIRLDIPVEEYELMKDLPILWVQKAVGKVLINS